MLREAIIFNNKYKTTKKRQQQHHSLVIQFSFRARYKEEKKKISWKLLMSLPNTFEKSEKKS